MKTTWIYIDTDNRSAIATISKCSQTRTVAEEWFKEHDPEGVVFEYRVIE
jgi:hypothetical protein